MNNINRAVVKAQAREIIKGKFFFLFIISFIAMILTGNGILYTVNIGNNYSELFSDDNSSGNYSIDGGYEDEDSENKNPFDDFSGGNPIENFEYNNSVKGAVQASLGMTEGLPAESMSIRPIASIQTVLCIIFAPLLVTLAGMYLSVVRRGRDGGFAFGSELAVLFKHTFNHTYLKKLCVSLLVNVITILLLCLFIIPGIIFSLSAFFAYQIISDNPDMSAWDAIKVSRKMVRGNRGELFVLALSFIPWILLTAVTLGIASIYVVPYMMTVNALYYENFRIRAMQDGRITAADFMPNGQSEARYSGQNAQYGYGADGTFAQSGAARQNGDSGVYYYSPTTAQEENPGQGGAVQPDSDSANVDDEPLQERHNDNASSAGGHSESAEDTEQNSAE